MRLPAMADRSSNGLRVRIPRVSSAPWTVSGGFRGAVLAVRQGVEDGRGWRRLEWQVDREYAALARNVADVEVARIRARSRECNGEPKPETRAISASSSERAKQFLGLPWRQSAAFIGYVDENAVGGGPRGQRYLSLGSAELESILQEIQDCGREELLVGIDGGVVVGMADREMKTVSLRLKRGVDLDFLHELDERDALEPRHTRLEPDFGKRTLYETSEPGQTASVHRARAPAEPDHALLHDVEREHRCGEHIAQLVRENAESFGPFISEVALALVPVGR